MNNTDTRVWAFANTGRLMHAFTAPWTDRDGNASTEHLRAECRGTIARHKDSLFVSAESAVPRCKSCEAKWNGYLARLEASMAPVNPYDQVCEGIEPETATAAEEAPEAPAAEVPATPEGPLAPAQPRRRDRHTARRVLADRRRTNRAAARIRRRGGVATVAGHCIAQGARPSDARSAASSLRRILAVKLGLTARVGTTYSGRRPAAKCTRWTTAQVAAAASVYRPRREDFKALRLALVGGAR